MFVSASSDVLLSIAGGRSEGLKAANVPTVAEKSRVFSCYLAENAF